MKRILVIDDDMGLRQTLRQMLEREGYEVVDASDGEEGIRLYRQAPTGLIVMDIVMPEKDGIETIIELKHDSANLKIIAISGGHTDSEAYLNIVENLGITHTFSKPFDRKELLGAIKELLEDVAVASTE